MKTILDRARRDTDAPLAVTFAGVARLVPLLVCGGFVLVTIALLALGPLDWHLVSPLKVYGFLAAAAVALVGGYCWATLRPSSRDGRVSLRVPSASTLVLVGSLVYLVLYLPTVHATTGKWYPDVWTGLVDTGTAYRESKDLAENGDKLVLYVRMLVAPVTILLLPLTLYFWPRLSRAARILGVTSVVLALALTVAQGINRGVAEMCANIVIFLVLVAAVALTRREYRRALKAVVGMVLVSAVFVGYYSVTISNRVETDAQREGRAPDKKDKEDDEKEKREELEAMAQMSTATPRENSLYYDLVPSPVRSTGVVFNSYVTHGYKGLDLALQESFKPTWGLGFSEFGRHNVLRAVGRSHLEDDVVARTYAGQIEDDGWPVGAVWGTFFIHPASDIGFPGTIVLMALVGLLFGLSWRDTLVRKDPLACGVFFHLCILVLYLPANNQLFQGGELTIGVSVLTVAWLVTRRRAAVAAPAEDARGTASATVS